MGKYNNLYEAINSDDLVAIASLESFEIGDMKFSIKMYAVEEYSPIYACLNEKFQFPYLFENRLECFRHAIDMYNKENLKEN
jgi:hypothetical protein